MHACGHDIHMTTMIGSARALAALESQVARKCDADRPAVRRNDRRRKKPCSRHLYERFGTPTMAIALHAPTNTQQAQSDYHRTDAVRRHLSRCHHPRRRRTRARPDLGKTHRHAAQFIMQIQTIAKPSGRPRDPTVVTVGDIHGGTKRNIIPDEVKMQLTLRAFSEKARETEPAAFAAPRMESPSQPAFPTISRRFINGAGQRIHARTYNDPALVRTNQDEHRQRAGCATPVRRPTYMQVKTSVSSD